MNPKEEKIDEPSYSIYDDTLDYDAPNYSSTNINYKDSISNLKDSDIFISYHPSSKLNDYNILEDYNNHFQSHLTHWITIETDKGDKFNLCYKKDETKKELINFLMFKYDFKNFNIITTKRKKFYDWI